MTNSEIAKELIAIRDRILAIAKETGRDIDANGKPNGYANISVNNFEDGDTSPFTYLVASVYEDKSEMIEIHGRAKNGKYFCENADFETVDFLHDLEVRNDVDK